MEHQQLVRFLLVEDDEDHAHLTMRELKKSRIVNAVDWVVDGEQAMQYLRREGEYSSKSLPSVVLLDLKLPRKSGLEVLEEIRGDAVLKSLPVVILTTSGEMEDLSVAYGLNVNSYLRKPVDFEQFRRMVSDLCLYWGVWNEIPPGESTN